MKRFLVIGASGLLGSHVVTLLKEHAEAMEASFSRSPLRVDIADARSLKALFDAVGVVDGVACTAGAVRFVPWARQSDGDWAHGLAHKLMGQINVVRIGSPYIRQGGAITLTSGILAQHPMPGGAIVTTVNAAVEGFVRAAGVELGDRLRVNAVSPGWVNETLVAMGMDPAPGLPAHAVAEHFVRQLDSGAAGSVLMAARQG